MSTNTKIKLAVATNKNKVANAMAITNSFSKNALMIKNTGEIIHKIIPIKLALSYVFL